MKQCLSPTVQSDNCWDLSGEKYDNASPYLQSHAFIDSSGMAWSTHYSYVNNNSRLFFVDTNGFKKPNQFGKDRFAFYIDKVDNTSLSEGLPAKIKPTQDNPSNWGVCKTPNKCNTEKNYFGTSWLYK